MDTGNGGRFEMVVFDVAGTTVWDGENPVARAVCRALGEVGVEISEDRVDPVMGMPKPLAIRTLLAEARGGEADEGEARRVHESFRQHAMAYYRTDPRVRAMEGAERVFAMLRAAGVRVTLDTGFDRQTLDTILDRLKWHGVVDDTVTSDEVDSGRPAADMIEALMERAGIRDAARVAKIGDSVSDIEQGLNAGCGLVVAMRSARTVPVLGRYPGVAGVSSLDELPGLLGLTSARGAGARSPGSGR